MKELSIIVPAYNVCNYLIVSNYYNYIFFLKQKRDLKIEKEIKYFNLTLKDKLKYLKICLKG
ncbi:MAG: hypothetical protein ACRC0Y_10120 [Fusobacteriaceae bacterium]